MLWRILVQFLFRLSFGLAISMAFTSSKDVSSGFFRVHLWVLLGVNTFLAMVVWLTSTEFAYPLTVVIGAGVAAFLSYLGAVVWLYEKPVPGKILLVVISVVDLGFAWFAQTSINQNVFAIADFFDVFTSGAVIGTTFTAMLLGHWYLNTPGMKLDPLRRLIIAIAIAVALRSLFSAVGILQVFQADVDLSYFFVGAVSLRWLAGLLGLLLLAYMSWRTLDVPNTQSATGILYVGVIFVFIGELASQLLSVHHGTPL